MSLHRSNFDPKFIYNIFKAAEDASRASAASSVSRADQSVTSEGANAAPINGGSVAASDIADHTTDVTFESPPIIDAAALGAVRRLKWVLLYHAALSQHMQRLYKPAQEYLQQCTQLHMVSAAPDDKVLGLVYFFLGVQLSQLNQYEEVRKHIVLQ